MNVSCALCGRPLQDDNCPAECTCGGTREWSTGELLAGVTDWSGWLKCPICRAQAGAPCVAAHSHVVDGHPAGGVTVLDVPHSRRPRSARPAGKMNGA